MHCIALPAQRRLRLAPVRHGHGREARSAHLSGLAGVRGLQSLAGALYKRDDPCAPRRCSLRGTSEALNQQRFHLVLPDLQLPDGSGLELVPSLEEGHSAGTEVVVITGPGNVRELCNAVDRAHILAKEDRIEPDCLPIGTGKRGNGEAGLPSAGRVIVQGGRALTRWSAT